MLKKMIIAIMAVGFIFGILGMSFAGEAGNSRKGKYTYRKVYKKCFERGEVASKKPLLNPDSMTQAQWKRIFDKKKFDKFGCEEEWKKLSEEDLRNIFSYLHGHAADSPTPAKCK